MSNFNYMEYACTKVIEEAEQNAINDGNYHELLSLFADSEVSQEALDTFVKYLLDNFECIDTRNQESVEDLTMFVTSIVAKYLDLRSIAGYELFIRSESKQITKYFDAVHGKYLMTIPESYEADEQ